MFKFESLAKAAAGVITLPVAFAADIATLGGMLSARECLYTQEVMTNVMNNLADVTKPK